MIASTRAAVQEHSKTAVEEHFKRFFEKYPQVAGIRWTQYTPYFNDGDPCSFGVGEFLFKLAPEGLTELQMAGIVEGGEDEDDPSYLACYDLVRSSTLSRDKLVVVDGGSYSYTTKELEHPLYQAIRDVVDPLIDDILETAFGDGVKVTATADGIDIEDYTNHH